MYLQSARTYRRYFKLQENLMSISLKKTFVPIPLQLVPRGVVEHTPEPIPVKDINNLTRLFASIVDTGRNTFNLSALPAGITVIDYIPEVVDILYNKQRYRVSLNSDNIVIVNPIGGGDDN